MVELKLAFLQCKRCGHKWIPRKEDIRQCPKCKSAFWDKAHKE
jgi:predicted Zn-ribbon and HTH transcriptional regulator